MTAPINPRKKWTAYQEALRLYWQNNGPRPGKILESVLHIEDLDPRKERHAHEAANEWGTRR